jgi:hypothetical protein
MSDQFDVPDGQHKAREAVEANRLVVGRLIHEQIAPLIARIDALEARVAEMERREREDRRP